MKLLYDDLIF